MKRKRHSPEQIVRKLREAEAGLATGQAVAEVCKQLGVTETTYYRWQQVYGGVRGHELKRLRELEKENVRLKKAVAELTLDKQILQEALRGNGRARRGNARRWPECSGPWRFRSVGCVWPWNNRGRVNAMSVRLRTTSGGWCSGCGGWPRSIRVMGIGGSRPFCGAKAGK